MIRKDGIKIRSAAFLIAALLFLPAISTAGQPLVWVTDDTPGGYYITGGGTSFDPLKPGLEIELYRMVADRLGLEIVFKRYPWNRCLQLIELNKVDGIFPASFKPERMEIGAYPMNGGAVDPSRKTRDNGYFLYKLETDPLLWDGKQFKNVAGHIGAPLGWAIVDDLKKHRLDVVELSINEHTLKLLTHRRLQGFVCLETVADAYLRDTPKPHTPIVKVLPPFWEKPYYLMISHAFFNKNPDLSQKIWDTIRDIKTSEAYQRLLEKYVNGQHP